MNFPLQDCVPVGLSFSHPAGLSGREHPGGDGRRLCPRWQPAGIVIRGCYGEGGGGGGEGGELPKQRWGGCFQSPCILRHLYDDPRPFPRLTLLSFLPLGPSLELADQDANRDPVVVWGPGLQQRHHQLRLSGGCGRQRGSLHQAVVSIKQHATG